MKLTKKSSEKRIREAWVSALNSGEYRQARGALHKKGHGREGFCCLGVLCELAVQAKVIPPATKDAYSKEFEYKGYSSTLPKEVVAWAGLSDSSGSIIGRETSLVILNDESRKSFKAIAKIIESKPEGLFKK